jgi:glutamate racemase
MKIGFFDSGIGGLTVLHQALLTLPAEDYIFYADVDHVPYGIKSKEEVTKYVDTAVTFLIQHGVKAIVIACNTATSAAIEYLRAKYTLPILGMEPAVKPAVEQCKEKRIIVAATPLTIKEEKLHNLVRQYDGDNRVDLLALPRLVEFAEKGSFDNEEVEQYLIQELSSLNLKEYSALILGCTHFNYFKNTFRKIFTNEVAIIDGSEGTINHLKSILEQNGMLEHGNGSIDYFLSGRRVTEEDKLRYFEKLHQRLDVMLRC